MKVSTIAQPVRQLGVEISGLLDAPRPCTRIILVSAFISLRTVLRLREQLLRHVAAGAELHITAGVDLGGTSREVLEELLRWGCPVFVVHNPNPRSTFHPKVYLFERQDASTLFVGSNNLTDGGFYTNYEAASRYDFDLTVDSDEYKAVLDPLATFLFPHRGNVTRPLDADLIRVLAARGELPTEQDARRVSGARHLVKLVEGAPESPFRAVATPPVPLLPAALRGVGLRSAAAVAPMSEEDPAPVPRLIAHLPARVLVWRKKLSASDALQVGAGTNVVGGVRLTQAGFEHPPGQRIDQTTYFRQLFVDCEWERETGRHRKADQEHTFVAMRLVIRGADYGNRHFEVSHKPSGEAGQDNYTTMLRWGRVLSPVIRDANLAGATISLYEVTEGDVGFLIDINDS